MLIKIAVLHLQSRPPKSKLEGARSLAKVKAELKAGNYLKNEPSHRHSQRSLTTNAQQSALMAISLKQLKFHEHFIMDT